MLGALPSFGLYEGFVRQAGGESRFLPPRADLKLPYEQLLEELEADPKRPLLLCSPNNPTGDALTARQVAELASQIEAPLLLDNAYAEFCRHDYRPLLAEFEQLVIFRTFSKAWSLGGVRLGYLLADPRLVAELIKVKLPYNLGHASAAIGEVVLENPHVSERAVRVLIGRRAQWVSMLEAAGLTVFPSEGNFLLVRCGSPTQSAKVRAGLGERGILVREMGHYPGLTACLRFAVGSGRALRETEKALREIGKNTQVQEPREPESNAEARLS